MQHPLLYHRGRLLIKILPSWEQISPYSVQPNPEKGALSGFGGTELD